MMQGSGRVQATGQYVDASIGTCLRREPAHLRESAANEPLTLGLGLP